MSYSRPSVGREGMTALKVDNLPKDTSAFTLKHVFEDYGPVGDVYIPQHPLTKEPYGCAVIYFYSNHDAKKAVDALNGTLFCGCELKVHLVHNNDLQNAQPDCGQGGQQHNEEENHEFPSRSERHSCRRNKIQSKCHSKCSPSHSEGLPRSCYHSRRRSSSIKTCEAESSASTQQPRGRPLARTRSLQQAQKKSESKSSLKCASKGLSGEGENIESNEPSRKTLKFDLKVVLTDILKEIASKTVTEIPPTTSHERIRHPNLPKEREHTESEEDHDMTSHDTAGYQPNTFEHHEIMTDEEQRESPSCTGRPPSSSHRETGGQVNDISESPDLDHDHLYFARLLGDENMEKNKKKVKNTQSKSVFERPHTSKGNATETLAEGQFSRNQTRKRQRDAKNWTKSPVIETGENTENNQGQMGYAQFESISKKPCDPKEVKSQTLMTNKRSQKKTRGKSQRLPRPSNSKRSEEDHDMTSHDTAGYQPNTFEHHEIMTDEEQRESPSCTGRPPSSSHRETGGQVNDISESPDLDHDHLYFARLLGDENMEKNKKKVKNTQSKSVFERPHTSKGNATETLAEGQFSRNQTRKRQRDAKNWTKSPVIETGENTENNQGQMGYAQFESISKKPCDPKEVKSQTLMTNKRSQKKTRGKSQRLPRPSNSKRSVRNTSNVWPSFGSETDQLTSFEQSDNRTQTEIHLTAISQSNPNTNGITGRDSENSNPQNDCELFSGHNCHRRNRKSQKQVDCRQPESTFSIPFTPDDDVIEVVMEDPITEERITGDSSPDVVIVGEMLGNEPLPHTDNVEFVRSYHYPSMDEPYSFSNGHTLPLTNDLTTSESQRRYSSTSEYIFRGNTTSIDQSTSVTPTNIITVDLAQEEEEEEANIPSNSNQAVTQNDEVIAIDQTSNTDLEFIGATSPFRTSEHTMTGNFAVGDNHGTDIEVEAHNSSSRQNNRRVHFDDNSSSISNSISTSTNNSRNRQQNIPTPSTSRNSMFGSILTRAYYRFDENDRNVIYLSDPPPMASPRRHRPNFGMARNSNSWPPLPNFANFNDIHNNHPTGLTKEQINTLPVRAFQENDKLNSCSICITKYVRRSKIRILPCFHEFHDKCIDRWISDNATCPICRKHIINPDDTETGI